MHTPTPPWVPQDLSKINCSPLTNLSAIENRFLSPVPEHGGKVYTSRTVPAPLRKGSCNAHESYSYKAKDYLLTPSKPNTACFPGRDESG